MVFTQSSPFLDRCIPNPASPLLSVMVHLAHPQSRRVANSHALLGKGWWTVKTLVLSLVLLGIGGVVTAAERTVIVPTDDKPFTVEKDDIVRLTGKGIAGAKIEAKVTGPVKLEAESTLRELVNGRPSIGSQVKEFDLKPTGKGKATVTITVTPPQPDTKPTVTKFEFEVK